MLHALLCSVCYTLPEYIAKERASDGSKASLTVAVNKTTSRIYYKDDTISCAEDRMVAENKTTSCSYGIYFIISVACSAGSLGIHIQLGLGGTRHLHSSYQKQ